MIEVGINGYGTIGKRVADAVTAQPDMTVRGVAKTSPNHEAFAAVDRGYDLYGADADAVEAFEAADLPVAGTIESLVAESDVIVDATPSGIGETYAALYREHETPALFQGGEAADVADASFTARANFDAVAGAESLRVVSCNTTGLVRLLDPLREHYGIERVRATLVRRGGDPSQSSRGPINDILPDPIEVPSHHGPDVQTVLPEVTIDTLALKVPATLMHVHAINVSLDDTPDASAVRSVLAEERRLHLVDGDQGIDGTGALKELALDAGRPRGDLWENCIWAPSITVEDGELYCFQAIHQESDVVPENVDAIRAVTEATSGEESREITNESLDIGF